MDVPLQPKEDDKKSYVQVHGPALPARRAGLLDMAAVAEPATRKVAVIVAHGMGSQVPFETLQMIADPLRNRAQTAPKPSPARGVDVELAELNGTQLPRARMTIHDEQDQPVDVHLYEIYWAPLTEGKVTARDALWFLLVAGFRGLWGAFAQGGFQRWAFGRWQRYDLQHLRLALAFLLAVLVLVSLFLMNLSVVAARPGISNADVALLTSDLWSFEKRALIYLGLGALLPTYLVAFRHIPGYRWLSRLLVALAIPLTIWTGAKVFCHLAVRNGHLDSAGVLALLAGMFSGPEYELPVRCNLCDFITKLPIGNTSVRLLQAFVVLAGEVWVGLVKVLVVLFGPFSAHVPVSHLAFPYVWAGALAVSWFAAWFLREYVGDVAVYVSAYAVSKFDEVRNQIQAAAMTVASAVYHQRGATGFEYEEIVVTGHSLGSVIAYDTLNALQNLPDGVSLDVPRRTKTFLTFGSPLDKTAFIFRNQRPQKNDVREALAAAKQPMILDYEYRPDHWVNIYSPDDWISGWLDFYDPSKPTDAKKVDNFLDPEANVPLAAHTFYWGDKILAEKLYQAIVR